MMDGTRRRVVRRLVGLATPLLTATTAGALVPAHADEPVLHRVTYIVTSETRINADIYYRDADPPGWADYSHNPYQYSPKVEAGVGPGARWTRDVMLADPDRWAMVTATSGLAPAMPRFHCELVVDGAVLVTNSGPKGALCSIRHW